MACKLCRIAVGLVFIAALTAIIYTIVSSGGGAWPVWTKLVASIGAHFGIKGAALSSLGYKLFSALLALGAAIIYLLADIIDWLLCIICQAMGACDECPPRPF